MATDTSPSPSQASTPAKARPTYVSPADLARDLNVSRRHVDRLRKKGLPYILVGTSVRIPLERALAWLEETTGQQSAEPAKVESPEVG